jgi:hypothetical protein
MKKQLHLEINKINEIYQQLDFQDLETYSNWLAQTYYFVRHSTRLLATSAGHCPFEYQVFHHRFLDHAPEEKSHEQLIENDFKNLGLNIMHFPENPTTKSFYQSQYYSIQNINPLSFLGYVMLLETLPLVIGAQMLEKIELNFGSKSVSFVKLHTKEDIQHIENLMKVIEHLDAKTIECIRLNLEQAGSLYCGVLSEILKGSQKSILKVA